MSDQVEMVAAEDAASNAEGSANAVTEQPSGEQPQAPVAAETAEVTDAPAALEAATPDQPSIEQPEVPVASDVAEAVDAPAAQESVDSVASAAEAVAESEVVEAPMAQAGADVDAPVEDAVAESEVVEAPMAQAGADVDAPVEEAVAESEVVEAPMAQAGADVDASVEEAVAESEVVESPVAQAGADVDAPVEDAATEPDAAAGHEVEASADGEADTNADDGSKSNVRILSVGQEVVGTVKRIAEFGAFIDIGVGRDGLIHISELSVRRVGKVTDVLTEGQEVTAWIKKLDRDRNRISLTLIDPNTKTIRDLNAGDVVQGTVTRILPYGAFVDIGIGRDALLHVREMAQGYVAKPEDVVKPGDTIEARIIELSRRRGRVDLSLKGLRPEPEPVAQSQPAHAQAQPAVAEPEVVEEVDDSSAEVEVLSPMELAFKRAMEAEGVEFRVSKKKQGKRNRRERDNDLQDDIVSRTLESGRK